MIKGFYAVTGDGLYHVFVEKGDGVVKKIGQVDESKGDIAIGDYLKKGSHVGITNVGLISYNAEHSGGKPLSACRTNNLRWREKTYKILALFRTEQQLREYVSKNPLLDANMDIGVKIIRDLCNHPQFIVDEDFEIMSQKR